MRIGLQMKAPLDALPGTRQAAAPGPRKRPCRTGPKER